MKKKVEKTRNSGTLTESAFWSMIRSTLRRRSMYWKPIHNVKLKARRENQSENKRLKWEYQCLECKQWFPDKEIEVDHYIQPGSLRCSDDLKGFIERLFCEEEGFRILCTGCHRENTNTQIKQKKDAKIGI